MTLTRILLSLLLLATGLACDKSGDAAGKQKTGTPRIRFIRLDASHEKRTLESLGSLVYYEKADVGSKVEGRIESIRVAEGSYVYQGQELARIEQLQYRLALQNAEMELTQSKNSLEMARNSLDDAVRNVYKQLASIRKAAGDVQEKEILLRSATTKLSNSRILFQAGGVSKTQNDDTETAYKSAAIALEQAKNSLRIIEIGYRNEDLVAAGYARPQTEQARTALLIRLNTIKERTAVASAENSVQKAANSYRQASILLNETIIRSPLTGYVAAKSVERGEQVKTDTKLFTVIDVSRMYANQSVSEDDIARIKTTGQVPVLIDAIGKPVTGRISLVHPLVDPRTRSVTVKVLIQSGGAKLRPGMFSRVDFPLVADAQAWLAPAESVVEKKTNAGFVWVLKDQAVFKTPVTTGPVRGDSIELTGGVKENMLIAITPKGENESDLAQLADGMKVIPVLPDNLTNIQATNTAATNATTEKKKEKQHGGDGE